MQEIVFCSVASMSTFLASIFELVDDWRRKGAAASSGSSAKLSWEKANLKNGRYVPPIDAGYSP